MLQRSTIIVKKEKSQDFKKFISENSKDKVFWDEVKKAASEQIDRQELEKAFKAYKY